MAWSACCDPLTLPLPIHIHGTLAVGSVGSVGSVGAMADQKVLETFKRFDSDGSGSISREELGEAGAEGPSILSTPFP